MSIADQRLTRGNSKRDDAYLIIHSTKNIQHEFTTATAGWHSEMAGAEIGRMLFILTNPSLHNGLGKSGT